MSFTRRDFLGAVGRMLAAATTLLSDVLRPFGIRSASGQIGWSVRKATADDVASMRDIFNAQLQAGLFPFSDLIEPWSEEKATRVLDTYTGTLMLELDGNPAGFAALIDYTAPNAESSIVPEADPEVKILAVRVDGLDRTQRFTATKHLALAVSRDLGRQGFKGCEATISAHTGFQDVFADQMEVKSVNERAGIAETKHVRFRIDEVVEELELQGF